MKIVNKPFTLPELPAYLATLQKSSWKPKYIVIHHTAAPSLRQRPHGFTSQHMLNIQDFYEGKGWSAGPHIFTDEDQAWMFTPLTQRGVHAVSFNSNSIGIEMLGDYDVEDPWTGRGLATLQNTAAVVKLLMKKYGLTKNDIRFHRDDPKTNKSCPGKKISKDKFLQLL